MLHKTITALFAIAFVVAGIRGSLATEFKTGDPAVIHYFCEKPDDVERLLPGLGQEIPADIHCVYTGNPTRVTVIDYVKSTKTHEIYSFPTPWGIMYSAAKISGRQS
jgi:hypothetical protein